MTMRFQPQNMSLFGLVGSIHKKYSLPLRTRQQLGFLLLAALEDFILRLVEDVYFNEADEVKTEATIDEMLDQLRFSYKTRFNHLTRNQTLVKIIENEFNFKFHQVEDEVEAKQREIVAKRSVRELLEHAFSLNESDEHSQGP